MFLTLLASLAIGAACAGVGYGIGYGVCWIIDEIISKQSMKAKMQSESIKNAFINVVDRARNKVKFTDFDTGEEYTVEGDGIADDIYEGQTITI